MRKLITCGLLLPLLMLVLHHPLKAQETAIKGTVLSAEDQLPLAGVTVIVKGTTKGTVSNADGEFSINVKKTDVVVVSSLGFKTTEIPVANQSQIIIRLATDLSRLDEVVVTGYQTQRKADLTGAVSVVSVDDAISKSSSNVLDAIEGRVPGVKINLDGNPGGGGTTIRIRGIGTLNNSSPLYVIDGVPTTENLSSINPNDIESMQILKDASSASIYGSRAANGVVIITTKKGKGNKLAVDFDAAAYVQTVAKQFEVLNSTEWGNVYWQTYKNDNNGLTPSTPGTSLARFYGTGAQPVPRQYLNTANTVLFSNTNWQDEIYRNALTQKYSVNISNGSDRGSMMFSVSHTGQEGVIDHSFYKRTSIRLNSDYKLNNYIKVGENVMVARWNDLGASSQDDRGIPYSAMRLHPAIPVRDINENLTSPLQIAGSDISNPVTLVYNARDNENQSWRMLGNAFVQIDPVKNLSFKSNFGLEHIQFNNRTLNRKVEPSDVNSVTNAFGQGDTWTWTNTANYNLNLNGHQFTFLAGTEAISYEASDFNAFRNNFKFEDSDYMIIGAGEGTQTNGGGKSAWSLFSLFAKVDYNFNNTYLFSTTLRQDKSSRLKENNSGIFPAFSGAWRISEESFIPKTNWIADLKLRAGWGQTGNQDIDPLAVFSTYGYDVGNGAYDLNGSSVSTPGIKVFRSGNPNLKWETTTQTNLGLDFSTLGGRVNASFDYFIKKTKDMLTIPPVLSVMGENSAIWLNTGDMENKGFEFILSYDSKKANDFAWGATFNASKYKNKLVKLNNLVNYTGGDQRNIVGSPIGVFYGFVEDGIFQNQDEVLNHATQQNKAPGRLKFRDIDNNGIINDNDMTIIGDPNPDLSLGLNLYANYKRFTVSAFLNSDLGFDIYNTTKRQLDFMGYGGTFTNRGKSILDAWTPDNPGAKVPALSETKNSQELRMLSYYIGDGSYLKVRNVRFIYKLEDKLVKRVGLSAVNVYSQVDNLFTITGYSGLDPTLPLSAIDNAPYPIARTFSLGINIKL